MHSGSGKIIVIVAPSGTGKSTLIKKLMQEIPELSWSVSTTTRDRREGEEHGRDYFFVSKEDFLKAKDNNDFLEWAEVHNNFYGTSKSFVEEAYQQGQKLLFDLDVQGCDSFKEYFGDLAKIIFIKPPSVEELEKRLLQRATDSNEVIERRLSNAKKELTRADDFDFTVVNDDFDQAYKDLYQIVKKLIEVKND